MTSHSTGPRKPPKPAAQLAFLASTERLLSEGKFTSTYKFALLLALTNIAVEQGTDSGNALKVDLHDVARQYISMYWNMARPYPRTGSLLKQNRDLAKPSRMITLLSRQAVVGQSSYRRLRVYRLGRDQLVSETRRVLATDVLYRLQTIGQASAGRSDRFLYDHPPTAAACARLTHITLKPGVCACLRRLRGVIVSMVQARWALWVRENNKSLGADRQLESFLFGASRTAVALYAARLHRLQNGRCFYTGRRLPHARSCEVDHFIPWSRYACDSPFNLVLTSKDLNNRMRDQLKPRPLLRKWLARNEQYVSVLVGPEPDGFGAVEGERELVRVIAEWVYGVG